MSSRNPNRALLVALLACGAASLFHYAHNAEFLSDYPNLPAWLSRSRVYVAWLFVSAIGAIGYWLTRSRHEFAGLMLVALYGALGLDGLGHYAVAPMSAHTRVMNASIGLEFATASALLTVVSVRMMRRRRNAS